MNRPKGRSNADFFAEELNLEILDSATVNKVFYAAARVRTADGDREVFGLACLIDWVRGEYNFGYKPVEESQGPCDTKCPVRILDLLPELKGDSRSDQWALKWRQECREYAAKADAARQRAKALQNGSRIRWQSPWKFRDGAELAELTFIKGALFSDGYRRYRLPRDWRLGEYEVVA